MARSAEKAMTALARFRKMKMEEGKIVERRPYLATNCNSLRKCEKWRRQIIGEISRKVSQIQNAGLSDFQLRDLNDEINKLMREKGHWEDRIVELGGPDYKKVGPKMLDHDGKEVPGNRGYKYFGAAKDLPGVRELFQQDGPSKVRRTRGQLMKNIDADYYGYRDEDDGVIVPLEAELEEKHASAWLPRQVQSTFKEIIVNCLYQGHVIEAAVSEWEETATKQGTEENIYTDVKSESLDGEETFEFREVETQEGVRPFVAHVPVPSQQDVEDALLRRKKRELLEKYASEVLQAQSAEAKTIMGV